MFTRLKSLELQGYKTFASKTVFDYRRSITAIVGPNGSGKSNIADSIRWVLGEQSYSLLRGKKTEDMIFSGSDQRPRASMASATMVFDNSDGWLPIDYSEVAITRRAYRDGTNEYLINNHRVRLKDVDELLAKSGLAERTYTVIGQGLVDVALSLKAEERRRLFEEAAGIGLYRARRGEAIRRLEDTRKNLIRVQDILSEIQPRMRSLERQSKRSKEYEQLKNDLKVLLLDWYGYHWHRAEDQLARMNEKVREQDNNLRRIQKEQTELEEMNRSQSSRMRECRDEISALQSTVSELYKQRESNSREIAVSQERLYSLDAQKETLNRELIRLQNERKINLEKIDTEKSDLSLYANDVDEAKKQVLFYRETYENLKGEKEKIEAQANNLRGLINEFLSKKSEHKALIYERKQRLERIASSVRERESLLTDAKQGYLAIDNQLKKVLAGQSELQKKITSQLNEIDLMRNQYQSLETKKFETIQEIQKVKNELVGLKTQVEMMIEGEKSLEGFSSGARLLNDASEQRTITGVLGLLGTSILVQEEYENAVAAVLGELVNTIVVEDDNSLEKALSFLHNKDSRGVLFRNNLRLKLKKDRTQFGKDEILGFALEYIKTNKQFQPLVDNIFWNVVIVKNRQAAQGLLENTRMELVVVTLNGEVYHPNGIVMVGGGKEGSIIGRKRRKMGIDDRIKKVVRRLDKLNLELASIDNELSKIKSKQDQLQDILTQFELEHKEFTQQEDDLKFEMEQIDSQILRLQDQIEEFGDESISIKALVDEGEKQLALVEKEIATRNETLQEASNQLNTVSLDEIQVQIIHWNSMLRVSERLYKDELNRIEEQENRLAEIDTTIHQLEDQNNNLENDTVHLQSRLIDLQNAEENIKTNDDEIRHRIEPKEAELEEMELLQKDLINKLEENKKHSRTVEHIFSQTRIELARQQERFDALSRRIEDDFGLVEFDYSDAVSGPTPLPIRGMVEKLPMPENISPDLEENIKRLKAQLKRLGPINSEAQVEFQEVSERNNFLTTQINDLEKAESDVRQVISELDILMKQEFQKTYDAVASEFKDIFYRLFHGGAARLTLTGDDGMDDMGIEIEARLPGRRTQGLSLLSGGERSLTATALIFALLKVSPTPFCVLDEVDAMLDETNVERFRELLKELSENTQFIIVTHNRNTVQVADIIYGVTMGKDSTSQLISIDFDELNKVI